ncbi:MAG: hypothetical protein D6778_00820, partial [Nitrospirae bacterium]
ERRPWIVVGEMEGALGLSDTKNSPESMTEMPYDHSKEGLHLKGRAGVFAKGSVGDYTITFRYDTRKPEDVLMQENIPSTEGEEFYPVYGDESEQFFEAQSRTRYYLRVDKGLSYFVLGDFQTDLGTDLDFNRYSRTFNGVLWNWQRPKNFKLRLFGSKNNQDIVRDELPGTGMPGPYFLSARPLEFSEKVWIEVHDRFNPQLVIDRRQLNRFTDYEINYEEGYIILKEPLRQFDQDLNPQFLVVTYETESLPEDQYMYGVRAEKWLRDLRLGVFGVKEEHTIRDKGFYGADIYYKKDKLDFVAEWSNSEGYDALTLGATSGQAYRVQLRYNDRDLRGRAFYKRTNDGFQNPSSATALESYETYGVEVTKNLSNSYSVGFSATVEDRTTI